MDVEHLVQEFADSVAAQSQAVMKGDAETGNGFARRYIAAFQALRARGNVGRDALVGLLSHERADVRVMAAAYLLRYQHERARAVLVTEGKGMGLTAFSRFAASDALG